MTRSAVDIANENVRIEKVCELIGMDMPDLTFMKSPKMDCPFERMHAEDDPNARPFRAYGETNSAYCYACTTRWTPVSLYAEAEGLKWPESAEYLLEHFGISKETTEDRWNDLIAPKVMVINTSELAESLRLFCARISPDWEKRQFEPHILNVFNRCLALLTAITTSDEVDLWRERTKQIMKSALA